MRDYSKKFIIKIFTLVIDFSIFFGIFISIAIASDHFIKNGDGTITDTKTSLMWADSDNGSPINWQDAYSYCQKFRGGGHTDWRMPTLAELESLYNPKDKNKSGYHIIKLIYTSADTCWASETRGNEAARFNFRYGSIHWLRQSYSGPTRVLPVRIIKKI